MIPEFHIGQRYYFPSQTHGSSIASHGGTLEFIEAGSKGKVVGYNKKGPKKLKKTILFSLHFMKVALKEKRFGYPNPSVKNTHTSVRDFLLFLALAKLLKKMYYFSLRRNMKYIPIIFISGFRFIC